MTRPCLVPSCEGLTEGRRVFCTPCWSGVPVAIREGLEVAALALSIAAWNQTVRRACRYLEARAA